MRWIAIAHEAAFNPAKECEAADQPFGIAPVFKPARATVPRAPDATRVDPHSKRRWHLVCEVEDSGKPRAGMHQADTHPRQYGNLGRDVRVRLPANRQQRHKPCRHLPGQSVNTAGTPERFNKLTILLLLFQHIYWEVGTLAHIVDACSFVSAFVSFAGE